MENLEENKPDAREEALRDFITDGRSKNKPKKSLMLRIAGLVLLMAGLGIMILWQKGLLMPLYKTVAYGVGGAGFCLYLIGRIAAMQKR
jgi:hypothetical protein